MSKIKNGGLDQYGAEPFEQQQFGRAGVEGVNVMLLSYREVLEQPGSHDVRREFGKDASAFLVLLTAIHFQFSISIRRPRTTSKVPCTINIVQLRKQVSALT